MRAHVFIILIALILTGCNINQEITVEYSDNSSSLNSSSIISYKPGTSGIAFLTFKTHKSGISYSIFFSNWKPYKTLDIKVDDKKLKIYYNEDEKQKSKDVHISFKLVFEIDTDDLEIYKNNNLIENSDIGFIYATE